MDKQTIGQFGWIVVVSMIIAIILTFATPFGESLADSLIGLVRGQSEQANDAYTNENMKEYSDDMNELFDASASYDAGLYEHNVSNQVFTWEELVSRRYIAISDGGDEKTIVLEKNDLTKKLNGDVIINDNITNISSSTFSDCSLINAIRLGSQTKTVGSNAFANCEKLERFVGNNSLGAIPTNMFLNCSSLKSISFSHSVKSIASNAFSGCSNLKTIDFYGMKSEFKTLINSSSLSSNDKSVLKKVTITCNDGKVKGSELF